MTENKIATEIFELLSRNIPANISEINLTKDYTIDLITENGVYYTVGVVKSYDPAPEK